MLSLIILILNFYLIDALFSKIYKNKPNKFNIFLKILLSFGFAIIACISFSILFPLTSWFFSLLNNGSINGYNIIDEVGRKIIIVFVFSYFRTFIQAGNHNKQLLLNKDVPQIGKEQSNENVAENHSPDENLSPEKPKLKAKSLIDVIPRNNYTENGFFFDLNRDFEDYTLPNKKLPTEQLMPVFYALRICFAGMYAQGLATRENFIETDKNFFDHMLRIGQSLSREEQVEFQEESLDKAIEWINHSYHKVERITTHLLVSSAKQGLSLHNALNSAIDTWETDSFSKNLKLDILNPEFCSMFYTMGGWMPNDNYQELAEKSYNFLHNPMLHPYALLFKNRIR